MSPILSLPRLAAFAIAALTALPVAAAAEDPAAVELSAGWEYRWGDPPAEGDGAWRPLEVAALGLPPGREGRTIVWFRTRLPSAADAPNPVVHLPTVYVACEVFLDGAKIRETGSMGPDPRSRYLTMTRHTIPLPPRSGGKVLALRIYSDSPHFHGLAEWPRVGPAEDVLKAVAMEGLDAAVLGVLFVVIGASALLLYVSRRGWTHVEYLSFGGFAMALGAHALAGSTVFEWAFHAPLAAYYLLMLGFVSFPVGLFAFVAQTLGEGPFRVVRRLWQLHLAIAVGGLGLDLANLVVLPVTAGFLLPLLAVDTAIVLFVGNRAAWRGSADVRILNAGAAILAVCGLHDVVVAAFFPGRGPWLHWGAFLMTGLLGYMLERRYAQSHRRLEEQTRTLADTNEALRKAHADLEQLKDRLEAEALYLQEEIKLDHDFGNILSRSAAMRAVLRQVEQVAATASTVLVLGETGTGKELVARAVHDRSPRRNRPLVKVNCAALPSQLIESELFGHEKGAFTGAISRQVGRFELADGGTLFLDEVGDLPLELQAKLLRVLQEGEFERLGSARTVAVDVRIIAATNRDLGRAAAEGAFRSDLYYRLNVFPIVLPPLRERREDIPILVQHFVQTFAVRSGKAITSVAPAVMSALQAYAWPGNVRELENLVERATVLSSGPRIEPGDWLPRLDADAASNALATLAAVEAGYIRQVLQATGWRVSGDGGAASILGLKRTTLEARMRRLGIVRGKA